SIRSTIDRYKKACSDNSNSGTVTEINAQQESAKLRQQIQMLQNSNRLERGITRIRSKKHEMPPAENEFLQKRIIIKIYLNPEIELENESVCLRSKLNAIHALASRNFFSPAIIEGGGTAYSHPDKKILYLG
ncbi:hypothetical protein CICLE_v10023749mg, partial [Citrus x clementina]